jgi:hypothetical protein
MPAVPVRPRARRFSAGFAAAAALAVVAAGCGGSGSSGSADAANLLTRAQHAAASAKSVHITGDLGSGSSQIKLDVQVAKAGDGRGEITAGGQHLAFVRIGSDVWVKGDQSFLGRLFAPADLAKVGDRYIKLPPQLAQTEGIGNIDITQIFAQLLTPNGKVSTVKGVRVHGKQTVGIEDKSGKTVDGILYVAASGTPYPLRFVSGTSDEGAIEFSDYGADLHLAPPPDAVDGSTLKVVAPSPSATASP